MISSALLQGEGCFLAALELEGDQRRAARSSASHDVGLRVILAARIDDAGNLRACSARKSAMRRALSVCCLTRSGRVSIPFSSVQALKGDMAGPV